MKEENKVPGFSNWKKNFPSFEKLFSQIIERRIWEKRRLWEENKPPAHYWYLDLELSREWQSLCTKYALEQNFILVHKLQNDQIFFGPSVLSFQNEISFITWLATCNPIGLIQFNLSWIRSNQFLRKSLTLLSMTTKGQLWLFKNKWQCYIRGADQETQIMPNSEEVNAIAQKYTIDAELSSLENLGIAEDNKSWGEWK